MNNEQLILLTLLNLYRELKDMRKLDSDEYLWEQRGHIKTWWDLEHEIELNIL